MWLSDMRQTCNVRASGRWLLGGWMRRWEDIGINRLWEGVLVMRMKHFGGAVITLTFLQPWWGQECQGRVVVTVHSTEGKMVPSGPWRVLTFLWEPGYLSSQAGECVSPLCPRWWMAVMRQQCCMNPCMVTSHTERSWSTQGELCGFIQVDV